jgi:hypothetical protein
MRVTHGPVRVAFIVFELLRFERTGAAGFALFASRGGFGGATALAFPGWQTHCGVTIVGVNLSVFGGVEERWSLEPGPSRGRVLEATRTAPLPLYPNAILVAPSPSLPVCKLLSYHRGQS